MAVIHLRQIKQTFVTFITMPTQGEKWLPSGGFKTDPPQFSWWAVGTLVAIVLVFVLMSLFYNR